MFKLLVEIKHTGMYITFSVLFGVSIRSMIELPFVLTTSTPLLGTRDQHWYLQRDQNPGCREGETLFRLESKTPPTDPEDSISHQR